MNPLQITTKFSFFATLLLAVLAFISSVSSTPVVVEKDLQSALSSLQKRDKCAMDLNGNTLETYSSSQIVSETVDCTGATQDCGIEVGKQHTETVESSWSLASGVSIGDDEFNVDVTATVGMSYSTSETSTQQIDQKVRMGYSGYLTYYVEVTRFEGTYRGCSQEGQLGYLYALKKVDQNPSAAHYAVVLTNK